jgi:hypothetical protein
VSEQAGPGRPVGSQPIPQSRTLSRTLRRQLASGRTLRLLVGESLDVNPDGSYTNVRIAGQDYTIPKLRGADYDIAPGRSVYILADDSFNSMIAIGWV